MAAPNIVSATTITGKTSFQNVQPTTASILVNDPNSGIVMKVNSLYVSNTDSSNTTADVSIYRDSDTSSFYMIKSVVIPANATLDVISKSFYLEEGHQLQLSSLDSNKLQAVCSYEQIS
jgi:hypothetical protein